MKTIGTPFNTKASSTFTSPDRQRPFLKIAIAIVLTALALGLRWPAFWMPHWEGEQAQYVTLAMKYKNYPNIFYEYHFREAEFVTKVMRENGGEIVMVYPGLKGKPSSPPGHAVNFGEREDFSVKPPLFPYLLKISHDRLAGWEAPVAVLSSLPENNIFALKDPKFVFHVQSWAAWIPVASSIAMVLAVFFLASFWFGVPTGIIAALILVFHPVDVAASQQVLPDGLQVLLALLAFLSGIHSLRNKSIFLAFLSGILMGLSMLTNLTSWLFLPLLVLLPQVKGEVSGISKYSGSGNFISGYFAGWYLFVGIGIVSVTVQWMWEWWIWAGRPGLWIPRMEDIFYVHGLPERFLYYTVGNVFLCPVILFAAFTLCKRQRNAYVSFLWLWLGIFLVYVLFHEGNSHRSLLPAYPAIAMLSAAGLMHLFKKLFQRESR